MPDKLKKEGILMALSLDLPPCKKTDDNGPFEEITTDKPEKSLLVEQKILEEETLKVR